jgi:hypothetical protein
MLLDIFSVFESSLTGVYLKNFLDGSAKRRADLKSFGTKLSKGIALSASEKERLVTRILYLTSFSNAPGYPKQEMARLMRELADSDIDIDALPEAQSYITKKTKYVGLSVCFQRN